MFEEDHEELVLVRDIEVMSFCEHHLLPFQGVAHVGYIPGADGRITGLSKLARLVEVVRPPPAGAGAAHLADRRHLDRAARPARRHRGLDCEHLCMAMRGIRKPGSRTITSAVRGHFERSVAARAEAMSLVLGR